MNLPVWRLLMQPQVTEADHAWFDRGKRGEGRLVLEDQNLRGLRTRGSFPGARFVRCDLSDSQIPLLNLQEIELVDCNLAGANFNSASCDRAMIASSSFVGATLQLGYFNQAQIHDSSFAGADLERGSIVGAKIERTSFSATRLVDTRLNDTLFVDCDLRDSDLSRTESFGHLATTTQARFVRCDLRGASFEGRRLEGTVFEGCRMDGIVGRPVLEGPVEIVEPVGVSREEIEAAWGQVSGLPSGR